MENIGILNNKINTSCLDKLLSRQRLNKWTFEYIQRCEHSTKILKLLSDLITITLLSEWHFNHYLLNVYNKEINPLYQHRIMVHKTFIVCIKPRKLDLLNCFYTNIN